MKLNVHVLGQHVGVLEQVGDFKSVMAYLPEVAPENLVSLTMPIRTESYPWDDELHPIFRMNLPERVSAASLAGRIRTDCRCSRIPCREGTTPRTNL
jgi:HipA-like protein